MQNDYSGAMVPQSLPQELLNSVLGALGIKQPVIKSPVPENDTLDDPSKLYYVAQNQANEDAAANNYQQAVKNGTAPTPDATNSVDTTGQQDTSQLDKNYHNVLKTLVDMRGKGIPTDTIMAQLEKLRNQHIVPGLPDKSQTIPSNPKKGNVLQQFESAVSNTAGAGWDQFVNAAKKIAQAANFPLSVLLGQAAIETGRSGQNAPGNNWFGIKGSGTAGTQNLSTQEADQGGNFYNTNSNFAGYRTPEDSINAYINLIKSRYTQAYAQKNNPVAMIQAIHKGGYATDPNYAMKVMSTPEFRQNVMGSNDTNTNQNIPTPTVQQRPSVPPPPPSQGNSVLARNFQAPIPQNQVVKPQQQPNFFQGVGNAIGGIEKGIGGLFGAK